jgi:hypothetical protein
MIRRHKSVDWEEILPPEDVLLIWRQIEPDHWYPMETFERLGVAILANVPGASLDAVRLWGMMSTRERHQDLPTLIAPGDPVESLMRLKVLRSTLFDFPAFDLPTVSDGHAVVAVTYHMGPVAEEAACHQTMGFCEGVLSLAGADTIEGAFTERAWAGAPRTLIVLDWTF